MDNKEEKTVQEKQVKNNNFKAFFTMKNLVYMLVVTSIFFALLNKFIALLAGNAVVYAIFFFISFGLAFSAFLIDLLSKLKNKEEKLDFSIVLTIFAMIISLA